MNALNADMPQVLLGAALGLGLAAAVGFRVFVPFLLVAIAAKSGQVHLAGGFEWLGTDVALVMFGLAALFEVAAYFIPFFDPVFFCSFTINQGFRTGSVFSYFFNPSI